MPSSSSSSSSSSKIVASARGSANAQAFFSIAVPVKLNFKGTSARVRLRFELVAHEHVEPAKLPYCSSTAM